MKKFYAGIGSRETPESVRSIIKDITAFLYEEGYILRSGGAPGADEMFESSLRSLFNTYGEWKHYQEIYIPWYLFQSSTSPLCNVSKEAIEFSLKFHPKGNALPLNVQKIMGRNAYQVLGEDLKTKSDFIVCWTSNGAEEGNDLYNCGGTGQALRIAEAYSIPIFNIKNGKDFKKWYFDNGFDML